jgi:ketosteroid isomerase-like protein
MKSRMTLAAAAAAAVLVVGCSKAPVFTPEDDTAVHALFDTAMKDLNSGNVDGWLAEFSDDAVLQPNYGKAIMGRASIAAWQRANPALEQITFPNVKISGYGDVAYGTSEMTVKMTGMPADTGKQLVVFKKGEDKKWTIVALSFNTDIAPAPPKAPVTKPATKAATKTTKSKTTKAPAKAPAKSTTKKGGRPASMSGL